MHIDALASHVLRDHLFQFVYVVLVAFIHSRQCFRLAQLRADIPAQIVFAGLQRPVCFQESQSGVQQHIPRLVVTRAQQLGHTIQVDVSALI